jgi:hypothetical protein
MNRIVASLLCTVGVAVAGRYYDPEVGVFTSVDPVGEYFNAYSYVGGNPILFIDPTGLAHEISAEEWDYRNANNMWDPPGASTFDVYVPAAEVGAWMSSSLPWSLGQYQIPADLQLAHGVMQEARQWAGTPYLWGGNTSAGIDCSHLAWQIYTGAGYGYSYSTTGKIATNPGLQPTATPTQGSLMLLNGHMGIYNPNNPADLSIFSATTSGGARWGDPTWWNGTPRYFNPAPR